MPPAAAPPAINGVLNIDKPAGMTSHDVVARVRRALRTKRVGHAGTLDPDATGVLVVAVGQATRLLPFLPTEPKEYVARLLLGVATTTEDASGEVTAEADASAVIEEALRAVLPRFIGEIQQVPPMVSAVHHEGRRLYELAREGVTVERQARTVTVHTIEPSDFAPGPRAEATLRVVCGGGTYIRTLCADIGAALGGGLPAHMKTLRRTRVGLFRLADALPLDRLEEEGASALLPVERALDLPAVHIDDAAAALLNNGMAVRSATAPPNLGADGTVMLLHGDRLRALARWEDGWYKPFKVFGVGADKDADR
jgi:tRNA pseudouridine55 synthase